MIYNFKVLKQIFEIRKINVITFSIQLYPVDEMIGLFKNKTKLSVI